MGNQCNQCLGKKNNFASEDIPRKNGSKSEILDTMESQQDINKKEKKSLLTDSAKLNDFNKTGDDVVKMTE